MSIALFAAGAPNSLSSGIGVAPVTNASNIGSVLGTVTETQVSTPWLFNSRNHRGGRIGLLNVDYTVNYTNVGNIGNPSVSWFVYLEYSPNASVWSVLRTSNGSSFATNTENFVVDFTDVLNDGRQLFWRWRVEANATINNLADSATIGVTMNSIGNFVYVN